MAARWRRDGVVCQAKARSYTAGMPQTTIKVDAEVRDRLAGRARRSGRTAGDELAALLDRIDAVEAWSQAATDYDALPEAARDELHQHELLAARDAAAAGGA